MTPRDGTQERTLDLPGAGRAAVKIEIKRRYPGAVLFVHECKDNTLRLTVEAAVSAKVSLVGAYLADADLADANLADADLARANLADAYLAGANLARANLADADLGGANLADANLADAYLGGANLVAANLVGADLVGAGAPVVPHIDAAVLRAVETSGNALNMLDWHTCETTHCRAGWAITLAGNAGTDLEARLGPCAAGALIYAVSRPDQRVPDFTASNEDALADLRVCAAADPLPAEAS